MGQGVCLQLGQHKLLLVSCFSLFDFSAKMNRTVKSFVLQKQYLKNGQ
jgi:hypothetical protein